jgi:hypothetical protein
VVGHLGIDNKVNMKMADYIAPHLANEKPMNGMHGLEKDAAGSTTL